MEFLRKNSANFLLFFVISILLSCTQASNNNPVIKIIEVVKAENEYHLNVDDFEEVEAKIKPNESLSEILLKYGISYESIDQIARKSKEVYDVRYLRADKSYKIYYKEDSIIRGKYFVYEQNPIQYVVFELSKPYSIYKGEKEVEIKEREAQGTISSSLYETMMENNLSPLLALELSEVYAWEIDFFRIQKGDNFKVVYEEQYVNDEFVGIGRILGANFNHFKEDYYAIYFEQGEKDDYFDDQGNSLRKAFLKAPLKFSRISSRYSPRRFHPILKRNIPHLGTDYAAPRGTPIMSVGDGVVLEAKYKRGNGNYVKIRHNSTYTTGYLHMSKIVSGMKPGVKVKQGQTIGYVGSTGLATGPHLCFRFFKNGHQIDALKVKLPPSKPIDKKHLKEYNLAKQEMVSKLENMELIQ